MRKGDLKRARAQLGTAPTVELSPLVPRTPIGFLERYLPFALSPAWAAFVAAFYGLLLDALTALALEQISGFREPNPHGYSESLAVTGRRGGKSSVEAGCGLYEAIVRGPEHMAFLAPGQRGYVVIASRTNRQAIETFRYARAIVERNAELALLLACEPTESQSGGELRFKSGVSLTVMPASKGSVRGFTVLAAILDEFAWIATDETSAEQDEEIASAIRYAMLAPLGAPARRLSFISSPAGKTGLVYDLYQKHYGNPKAPVLVVHGPTTLWNPSVDPASITALKARDPKRFAREVLAEFSDAVSSWIDDEAIDRATVGRTKEPTPPAPSIAYHAAVDMAFKRDSSVLVIGHQEPACRWDRCPRARMADSWHCEEHRARSADTSPRVVMLGAVEETPAPGAYQPLRFIVDGFWRWTPSAGVPLDSTVVVAQMCSVARRYGIRSVVGDQFASVPLANVFDSHGVAFVEHVASNTSKAEAFMALREAFYSSTISIPPDEVALRELRELQERQTGAGNVQIGHPNRATAHDDHAMALAWLYHSARTVAQFTAAPIPGGDTWIDY